ncbi:serine racemase-like [Sciurus carolinensis]|uniref:serine racemase-like n=1 Tax=Sciurus carolinensis TaxID=30640 RepID=UPI001FB27B5C|nr:serine racemase-like [Sciurus carolinensis]
MTKKHWEQDFYSQHIDQSDPFKVQGSELSDLPWTNKDHESLIPWEGKQADGAAEGTATKNLERGGELDLSGVTPLEESGSMAEERQCDVNHTLLVALKPSVKVYAAEPLNADDCYKSKLRGELTPNPYPPETIADGVKSSIGLNTWPIIRDLVDDVFTVTEDEIKYATQLVWERMKLLIEPTAGVGVAAVLSRNFEAVAPEVKNICIVLSGGNVDLTSLSWVKQAERPAP